jgi:carboxymethylenebutenolidase
MPADSSFRPSAQALFPPGSLGDKTSEQRDTISRQYCLENGTPIIHAMPDGEPAQARLVLIPSLRGHNAMLADLSVQLASRFGYEVISPELFPGRQHLTEAERIAACPTMDDDAVIADIQRARARLSPGSAVVIGFCLGGMYALKAGAGPGFRGAVSFYGFVDLPPDWQMAGRESGREAAVRGGRPVLGIYGGADPLIDRGQIDALGNAGARMRVFEDCGHAFAHDPLLPSYHPEAAAEAWRATHVYISEVCCGED